MQIVSLNTMGVKMKRVNKPTKAFIDLDSFIFKAASTAEQQKYDYLDSDGNVVATFESASEGKSWCDEVRTFGCDFQHGYEGDVEDLTRSSVYYEDKGKDFAEKQWRYILKSLIEDLPDTIVDWVGYVSVESGSEVFRHNIACLDTYKGNRENTYRPKHLEYVRDLALSHGNIKGVSGGVETDDYVQAYAQKHKDKGLLVSIDKDIQTAVGCWILLFGRMDDPVFSDPSVVGQVYIEKGKMYGYGYLYLVSMALTGDSADCYKGLPKCGTKKAFDLLSPFNGKPSELLKEVLQVAIKAYKDYYGDSYTFKHCTTGEDLTMTPYELFENQMALAYMIKSKNDTVQKSVLKCLKGDL